MTETQSPLVAGFVVLVLFLVVPGPLFAAGPTVRLRESVDVTHGPLSLSDVIVEDLSGTNYTLRLGSLPQPGHVKFVSRAYVMMLARNADKPVPQFVGERVRTRVQRPARTLKGNELKSRMKTTVRNNLSDRSNLRIVIEKVPETLTVLPGPYEVTLENPGVYQSERGSVWYRFGIKQKGTVTKSFRAKVLVSQFRKVPVAVRRLKGGTVLQPKMIEWVKRKINSLRGGLVTDPKDVIGYELTRNVRADKIIQSDVLKKPIVIERRDRVTIRYRMGGVTITTKGTAREDGAIGDVIRVENISSEKRVSAEVINERLVEVNRPTSKEGNNQ